MTRRDECGGSGCDEEQRKKEWRAKIKKQQKGNEGVTSMSRMKSLIRFK